MSLNYDRFTGSDEHRLPPAGEEEAWAGLLDTLEQNLLWVDRHHHGGVQADTPAGAASSTPPAPTWCGCSTSTAASTSGSASSVT